MNNYGDLSSRLLLLALKVLGGHEPFRISMGLLLGCVLLGPINAFIPEMMNLFTVISCLAFGPLICVAPLLFSEKSSIRPEIRKTLSAAEMMIEQGKLTDWDRRDFYLKSLGAIQKEMVDLVAGKKTSAEFENMLPKSEPNTEAQEVSND